MTSESDAAIAPSGSTRVWADDVNGDGKLDLLVGDYAALTYPAKGLSEEECRKRLSEWQSEQDAFSKAFRNGSENAEDTTKTAKKDLMDRYTTHYMKRSKIVTDKRTGFVWLYLQQ